VAAFQLQMLIDRADQEALPIGERGELPLRLGSCERLQLADILKIGIRRGRWGAIQQRRGREA
jgi:hypothetical protein